LNSRGVTPVSRLKARSKVRRSWKPTLAATLVMVSSRCFRISIARSTRRPASQSRKQTPVLRWKKAEKYFSSRPAARAAARSGMGSDRFLSTNSLILCRGR